MRAIVKYGSAAFGTRPPEKDSNSCEAKEMSSTVGDHLLTDSECFVIVTVNVGHVCFAHQRLILLIESTFDGFTCLQ